MCVCVRERERERENERRGKSYERSLIIQPLPGLLCIYSKASFYNAHFLKTGVNVIDVISS